MASRRARRLGAARAVVLVLVLALGGVAGGSAAAEAAPGPVPVLAYYYIWFNATSWNHAKIDYPLLGRYSSDERSVMARHVRWAQEAGIDGFVVSWKSTPVLDRRLRTLVGVAARAHFRLAIIYQGLDYHRRPLPVARVRADLQWFASHYERAAPFRLYDRPLVVWSGTWQYTPAQVASVTGAVRDRLLVLASEKNAAGYARLAGAVDGDAYYWSSADPLHTPGYAAKLRGMGRTVHRSGGIWIAPAAPGFDARAIGGTKVVPRRGGATLRRALDGATTSSPDLVGLISWNEFTENSDVEPSQAYGFQSLHVLADALHARVPTAGDLDSSQSSPTGARYGLPLLIGFVAVLLGGTALMARRRRTAHAPATDSSGGRRSYPG